MSHAGRHTEVIEPLTEDVPYGWTPRPPRRRDWRAARNFAGMCAGYAWALAGLAVTFLLLRLAVGK